MNRALRLLGAFAVMLLSIPAMGGEWVDTYWPVNAGNTWYFTSGVTVGIDNFESYEYQIWQETDYEGEYDYLYEVHHLSDGKVYFDCADAGWQRVCVSPDVLLDVFAAPKTQQMQRLAADAMTKTQKVYYFDRADGIAKDISDLDPDAEGEGESGWGGLSEFSGRANQAVARAVANSNR